MLQALSNISVQVPSIKVTDTVTLSAEESALVVVDMQNDFVNPKGRLYVSTAPNTITPIKTLLNNARRHQVMTIFTQDTHYPGDPEFNIWGQHVVKGTWGWQIVDELAPLPGEIVIEKTRYDGFYGTPLDDLLRSNGIKHVVVVGTVANICVLHTIASAALRWYKVYTAMDAISAINEFDYYLALRQIDFLYKGIIVQKAENIEFKGVGRWPRS